MADEAKIGTIWQAYDLALIVADCFAILEADLAGRPYVKSKHSRELMARTGRTHRSIEFKHQNISVVVDQLGMPWIPGCIPNGIIRTQFSTRSIVIQLGMKALGVGSNRANRGCDDARRGWRCA